MRISAFEISRIESFIEFNKKIYPSRNKIRERFLHQIIDNPLLIEKDRPNGNVSYDDNGDIVGQFLVTPCRFHFSGKEHDGFFGCDFYVSHGNRGMGGGGLLAMKTIRAFKPYFAIGVTDVAHKIHLSAGTRSVGDLQKYIWFNGVKAPLLLAGKLLFGGEGTDTEYFKKNDFPPVLLSGEREFALMDSPDVWDDYCWEDTLSFVRTREFLKWRFWGKPGCYYFYLSSYGGKQSYFVVRKTWWKGLRFLSLVDYKVPSGDHASFEAILSAAKKLAQSVRGCQGVVTFSSHVFFDRILNNKYFISVGSPNLILTNAKLEIPEKDIAGRNFIYATPADSDVDYNFDDSFPDCAL